MKTDKFSLTEALDLLDLYAKADKAVELAKQNPDKFFPSEWNDNYNDLIWGETSNAANEAFEKHGKLVPEVGDIAVLKIKLRNPDAPNKRVYDGCELRPVLVIRATTSKVDAVEITHNEYFHGHRLILIGKLRDTDAELSYINIYTIDDYTDLATSYKFPYFNADNSPMTAAEYYAIRVGVIYNGPNKDNIYLADFNYRDSYKGELNSDLVNRVIEAIFKQIEE